MSARNFEIEFNNAKLELTLADLNVIRAKAVLAAANKSELTTLIELAEVDLDCAHERVEVALAAKIFARAQLRFAREADKQELIARVNAIPARLERWINNL